jgi:glutaredoxin
VLGRIRTKLHGIIDNPRGDAIAAVRVPKMFARRVNDLLGSPLCSAEDLEKRRAALAKLESLRGAAAPVTVKREAAPVVVYFEKDRNQRLIERVQELLASREIAYRALDVTGDEATLAFVMREAKCEEDDLPIVYVAGTPVGGYNELVEWDVSGKLKTSVFG